MDHALVFWQARLTWDPPANLLGDERRSWIERMDYRKTLNSPTVGAAAAASLPLVVDRCADQLDRHLDANGGGAVAAG
jgi:hypothetical protein